MFEYIKYRYLEYQKKKQKYKKYLFVNSFLKFCSKKGFEFEQLKNESENYLMLQNGNSLFVNKPFEYQIIYKKGEYFILIDLLDPSIQSNTDFNMEYILNASVIDLLNSVKSDTPIDLLSDIVHRERHSDSFMRSKKISFKTGVMHSHLNYQKLKFKDNELSVILSVACEIKDSVYKDFPSGKTSVFFDLTSPINKDFYELEVYSCNYSTLINIIKIPKNIEEGEFLLTIKALMRAFVCDKDDLDALGIENFKDLDFEHLNVIKIWNY